jgi:RHS repeat-associated protein
MVCNKAMLLPVRLMAGISDKAVKSQYAQNKYKFNGGNELQNQEFSGGSGLENYDLGARFYDSQIGRFFTINRLSNYLRRWSPYTYGFDNPCRFADGDGMAPSDSRGKPDPPPRWKILDPVTVVGHKHHSWFRKAISWVSVVGGLVDGVDAAVHGHWGQAGLGLVIAVADVFTLGEGGLALHAGEELLEHAAEELTEHEIENAAVKAEEEVAEQAEKNLAENIEKETAENTTTAAEKGADVPKGFKETKEFGRSHGQKVYKKGKNYYSKDVTGHNTTNGWKVFKKVGNRLVRIATADKDLKSEIMISDSISFEKDFIKTFGDNNRSSLVSVKENRIRVELGGSLTVSNRVEQALFRSKQILQYCFGKSQIWLRIILWDDNERENLKKADFKLNHANLFFEGVVANEKVLYVHFKEYAELFVNPIILAIINYEINKEPYANITCYFINFSTPVLLNIYDDRGMDIFSPNKRLINGIADQYNSWLI